ncbi:type IV secretory system conjugative DNA transfer family protein [Latilactobacillus graminis]|uniref:TraD/TraG TraM recognition site domain-containing protein n=1 Tax=Latilactobacillus graminis DSM 20719 TaxID=1423752 RepID=A0AA89I1K7_9LACO|nr:type IV secretory system conjugative DNA transfer family protein [Latilactobacillus graminis]KRM23675.1 hypothetical protein FC90_GL001467 [Latilactobacillus graminis DSM 20719]
MIKRIFDYFQSSEHDTFNKFTKGVTHFFEKNFPEDSKREGYEDAYQNRLRFLANERILKRIMLGLWFMLILLENYVVNSALATSIQSTVQTAVNELRASGLTPQVNKPGFFSLLLNVFSHPFIKFVLFALTTGFVYTLYVKIHDNYRPLEYDLTQGTTTPETNEKMRHDYPSVEIKVNAPAPAYVKGTIGIPIRQYPQTEEQKARGVIEFAVATEPSHVVALAHTRAGKSIYLIDPAIYIGTGSPNQAERRSIIYLATAGDEPRRWRDLLLARGYRIRIINTVDPSESDPYPMFNILMSYYKDYYECRLKAKALLAEGKKDEAMHYHVLSDKAGDRATDEIIKASDIVMPKDDKGNDDSFWVIQSRTLFRAVALALCEQSLSADPTDPIVEASIEHDFSLVNGYTIQNVVNKMFSESISADYHPYLLNYAKENTKLMDQLLAKYDGQSALDVFFGEMDDALIAKEYYRGMMASKDAKQTLGNIVQNFNGDMEWFMRSSMAKMTAANDDFNFDDLAYDTEKPTALFIMMSDSEADNNGLGFLAYEQIYQRLNFRAYMNDDSVFPRDVWSFNDEAGNTGKVLNLANKWTASLKKHFFIFFILQDLEQMTELYGESVKDTILGNTGILYYIRSGSLKTNKYISESIGKRAVYKKRRSVSGILDLGISRTEEVERIPILEPFELRELAEGNSVVLRLMHTKDGDGKGIYQKPIINRLEDGTASKPFYEWCQLKAVPWKDMGVNNKFLMIDRIQMQWELRPNKRVIVGTEAPVLEPEKEVINMTTNEEIKATAKTLKVTPVLIDGDRESKPMTEESVRWIGDDSRLVDEKEEILKHAVQTLGTGFLSEPYNSAVNMTTQIAIRNIIDNDGDLFKNAAVNNEYGAVAANDVVDSMLTFIASNFSSSVLDQVCSCLINNQGEQH